MPLPVESVITAMRSALTGDVDLGPLVTEVYALRADPGSVLDYIVIGSPSDASQPTFRGARIDRGELELRLWSRDIDPALTLYEHVKRILHRVRLPLAANTQIAGKVELRAMVPDPTDRAAVQAVAVYTWMAHVSA
jgi:hypothetical protein